MTPVLIDCDPGIDDTLALLYLAALDHLGEIDLCGVTTTAGNTTATQAAGNARWVRDQLRIDAPVLPGRPVPLAVPLVTTPETHGPTGLGYLEVPAAPEDDTWPDLWVEAIEKHEDLHLIVTGPCTNLATFRQSHPEHHARLRNVTVMGGAVGYRGNTTPTAEWNFWVDPHAAADVIDHTPAPVTLCSLEVTEQFLIDPPRLEGLIADLGPTPVAKHLPEILRFYFEFHQAQGEGYQAQIHDLLTCMIALERVGYEHRGVRVDVDTRGERRGTSEETSGTSNTRLVTSTDIDGAHAELTRAARALR